MRDEAGIGRRPDEGKQGGTYGNTMIYYIADMHFGHENVIRFDDRPFADTEQMDEVLIQNDLLYIGEL